MEYFIAILSHLTGDDQLAGTVFIGLVAVSIFIVAATILFLAAGALDPARKRIREVAGSAHTAPANGPALNSLLEAAAPHILPKEGKERSHTAKRLGHAGFTAANAMTRYYAIKLLLGFFLFAAAFLFAELFPRFDSTQVLAGAVCAGFVGMLAPNYALAYLARKRQRLIRNAFPDALDLLVVSVEAGLGLSAAIQRVAQELAVSSPELAAELELVNAEVQVGIDREQALRNLAERTGLDDIRGLVTLLAQSMRFGTSIADTLRVYADEFRDKRTQKAEEQAAMIGTKMIFPLVLCIFPSFFIVMVGPAILGVLEAMKH